MIFLDTHVVSWLYDGAVDRLSEEARHAVDDGDVLTVSPMVRLELDFLHEVGRFKDPSNQVLSNLSRTINLRLAETPFDAVVRSAGDLGWTRDPFDRLIVAQALAEGSAPLITKDRTIRNHYPPAVW